MPSTQGWTARDLPKFLYHRHPYSTECRHHKATCISSREVGRSTATSREPEAERERLQDAVSNLTELREAVERWVGPMVLRPDGTIVQKQSAAESATDVKGVLDLKQANHEWSAAG